MIKAARYPGPEPVVDVDNPDAGHTTVQHRQQGSQALVAGAVADAGGNGDDRRFHQPANYGRQRPFHASDDHYHLCPLQSVPLVQQSLDAGHAHVGNSFNATAHQLRRYSRLGSNGQVRGPGAKHKDSGRWLFLDTPVHYHGPRCPVVLSVGNVSQHRRVSLLVGPCDQQDVRMPQKGLGDGDDLLGSLSLSEHYFGKTASDSPVMINFGEVQVLVGKVPQFRHRIVQRQGVTLEPVQDLAQAGVVDG